MFDDLRERSATTFVDVTPQEEEREGEAGGMPLAQDRFLGMTAVQRLVLAVMLFLNVCVLGCFCLLATERVALF